MKTLVLGDGKSVDRYQVEAIVREMLDAMPKPEPGRDALELDVRRGLDHYRRYHPGEVVAHRGGLIRSFRQTDPVPVDFGGSLEDYGWHVVMNGLDGLDVEVSDDFRHVTVKLAKTDGQVITKSVQIPVTIDRGVYRETSCYSRGDGVTWDGSWWLAQRTTIGEKPGSATKDGEPSWRLAVRRGNNGRDGNKGDKGDRGAEGRAGRDLTQLGPDGRKW